MPKQHIFTTSFATVYSLYVQKAERKNRTKADVDHIICWLTGYDAAGLQQSQKARQWRRFCGTNALLQGQRRRVASP